MVAHQLDLFGGPLKPPKKIKVDDDILADVPAPVSESIPAPGNDETPINISADELRDAVPENDLIVSNDAEWTPAPGDDANETAVLEAPSDEEDQIEDELVETIEAQGGSTDGLSIHSNPIEESASESSPLAPEEEEEEPSSFTNEAILASDIDQIDEVSDELPIEEPVEEPIEEPAVEEPREEPLPTDKTETPAGDDNIQIAEEPNDELIEEQVEKHEETTDEPLALREAETETSAEDIITAEAGTSTTTRRKSTHENEEEADGLNVPPDEELFKRQYYSMRETSAMFNVNQSLLRFWENEFDILQPKKNKKGDRYFRPVDVKNLVLIYHLLRVRKFTMDGAKDYLQSHKKAGDTFELIKRLEKLKTFLFELKAGL